MPRLQSRPRTDADAAFLARYDSTMRLPIIVSALLPLIVAPQQGDPVSVVIGIVTWLVFLVDYIVHARHLENYTRTGFGHFDLFVVIATAPWFLLPGAQGGGFVVLLRLARVARILMVSRNSRQLFERLGRVAAVAVGVLITASLVAYYAEHPTNPEFATVGDALWWGIVTLTTVGYGDIVPKTPTGRWAAVVIMITGVTVLGLLAGSLASFLRLEPKPAPADEGGRPGGAPGTTVSTAPGAEDTGAAPAALGALVAEVAALREQVAALSQHVTALGPGAGAAPGQLPGQLPGQAPAPAPDDTD